MKVLARMFVIYLKQKQTTAENPLLLNGCIRTRSQYPAAGFLKEQQKDLHEALKYIRTRVKIKT